MLRHRIKFPPEAIIPNTHLPLGTPYPHLYLYYPLAAEAVSVKLQLDFFGSTKTALKAATSLTRLFPTQIFTYSLSQCFYVGHYEGLRPDLQSLLQDQVR